MFPPSKSSGDLLVSSIVVRSVVVWSCCWKASAFGLVVQGLEPRWWVSGFFARRPCSFRILFGLVHCLLGGSCFLDLFRLGVFRF